MITNTSDTPTCYTGPNGEVLVWVPGKASPMTWKEFQFWSASEAWKNATGRPFVHL